MKNLTSVDIAELAKIITHNKEYAVLLAELTKVIDSFVMPSALAREALANVGIELRDNENPTA
jgi:hypothetical protein